MNATNLCGDQYQSKRDARCTIPGDDSDLLVRELADVHACRLVRLVQAPLEEVRELIELAELPLRVWRVCATAHVGRVLVVFLHHHQAQPRSLSAI